MSLALVWFGRWLFPWARLFERRIPEDSVAVECTGFFVGGAHVRLRLGMADFALDFPFDNVLKRVDVDLPPLSVRLLDMDGAPFRQLLCDVLGYGPVEQAPGLLQRAHEAWLLVPRKKRRKSLAWLRLLVPLADEKQLVVWWTDRPFLGADRFIWIGQKLGAVAFDSYHDPMLDRVKMEQEGQDLREMVCEMTGEACSQFYPFYSEGNGDYYGWLDSAFGQVVLLDHEEAAFRPTHASFDAWFYWRLT